MKNFRETIPHPARAAAAGALQEILGDLIDLALQAKQAHWAVTGPHFLDRHAAMDGLAAACHESADEFAERMLAMGFVPQGQVGSVAARALLAPLPDGFLSDTQVAPLMADRLAEVLRRMRARLDAVQGKDVVTDDLITQALGALEKQLWMLQAREG